MIDLYYWTTPNGHKITILLEEASIPYTLHPVDITRGQQFDEAFLRIAPNNRIPAIIDNTPLDGGKPISLFESGVILRYLAEKCGMYYGGALRQRLVVEQWLMWQMSGLGPMCGQVHHFLHYAPKSISDDAKAYVVKRYVDEVSRLYAVLDRQLVDNEWIAGAYSIADIACYPWVLPEYQQQNFENFPHLMRWHMAMKDRPSVQRAYAIAENIKTVQCNHDNIQK